MGIEFTHPIYLLLLPIAGYFVWHLTRDSLSNVSGMRAGVSLVLRLVIVFALIFAVAGVRTVRNIERKCVVFVLDVSESVPKTTQKDALEYINSAILQMNAEDLVGLVTFGADALIEQSPGVRTKIDKIHSVNKTSQTNISQALALAMAMFSEKTAKKIVLISDGNETKTDALRQASVIGAAGVSVDVVEIAQEARQEALLEKLIVPESAKVGEPFELRIVAQSTHPADATVRIVRNGVPVDAKSMQLVKGKSTLTFRQSADKAGSYEYEAFLEVKTDHISENNRALGHIRITGKPRVLYAEGVKGQAHYLVKALSGRDVVVDRVEALGIPKSLPELLAYDMVVVSDIPAWHLTASQMLNFRSAVRDMGIGFAMIGGENSFGAGGYFDTPVEQLLPVNMSVKKEKVMPASSVLMVMDKSGSMGADEGGRTKMSLANDAAAAVVDLLEPVDYAGVIVCHDFPVTTVTLAPAIDKDAIRSQISQTKAEGGGIMVYPAMKTAAEAILSAPTRTKHIILLADGADCEQQEGTISLVRQLAAQKVTTTAVAIGDGPDVPFLRDVAQVGGGGFYLAQRGSDLKAIFTKDVMQIAKSAIIEEPFIPTMDDGAQELSGISAAELPTLLGYVATTEKPAAQISMLTDKEDPLLASWQFGLGRSLAFTSDCKARWGARWLSWGKYDKFWAQVLRSVMRRSMPKDLRCSVDITNLVGHVSVDAVDAEGNFINSLQFAASVVNPDKSASALDIQQTGPGSYEAEFEAEQEGTYVVNIVRKGADDSAPISGTVSMAYSPEYKYLSTNTALLQNIAASTQGKLNPDPKDIFRGDFRPAKDYSDLWRVLVLLCAFLMPIDVAIRRLAISVEEIAQSAAKYAQQTRLKRQKSRKTAEPAGAAQTLLESQRERKAQRQQPQTPTPTPTQTDTKKGAQTTARTPEPADRAQVTSRLLSAKRRANTQQKDDNTKN